jgi:hypothetical protein
MGHVHQRPLQVLVGDRSAPGAPLAWAVREQHLAAGAADDLSHRMGATGLLVPGACRGG